MAPTLNGPRLSPWPALIAVLSVVARKVRSEGRLEEVHPVTEPTRYGQTWDQADYEALVAALRDGLEDEEVAIRAGRSVG